MYKKIFFYSLIIYKFSYIDFYYYFEFKLKILIALKYYKLPKFPILKIQSQKPHTL